MRRYLASTILLAFVTPAAADPRPMAPAAKTELDRGLERYGAHDYATAIAAFDAGYAVDPHPDFLYAKAQAQRLGGDCRGAIATYTGFLNTNPPAKEADLARGNVARCETILAASRPPPEEVQPVVVPPHHEEPVDRPAWYADRPGLVLAGGGVVLLGLAAAFAVRASSAADDATNAGVLADWANAHDAWQTDRVVAGIAAGVGAALLIGAGYRFWSVSRDRPRVVAVPVAHGATLALEAEW
jgi:hypothetical protein